MAMIFQKRSTRTRVSTESGFAQLGGHPLFLGASQRMACARGRGEEEADWTRTRGHLLTRAARPPSLPAGSEDIQLGKNESLLDTGKVLSRYNDVILARVYGHKDITDLCAASSVPVINALSDTHHPLQGLADLMTLEERFGRTAGLTIAWVGDGNNILNTFLSAAAPGAFNVRYATPKGYEPPAAIVAQARAAAAAAGVSIVGTHDPQEAVRGADVVVTDTWVSMGQEEEAAARVRAFKGYQVTEAMVAAGGGKAHWVFLHCLPRKPQEVDDAVFYSPRSLVFDEAENRKWTVMAVALAQLLGGADV
jgi:ornithine carbamoyltransferase